MNNETSSLIEESIKLELNVSNIYSHFHHEFKEDGNFWWKLSLEEKNHAALIRSGKAYFETLNQFPHDIIHNNLQTLLRVNKNLQALKNKLGTEKISRQDALNLAISIESSAGEFHFQQFMSNSQEDSSINRIFKDLNQDDKDHEKRIRDYMKVNQIKVNPVSVDDFL